MEQKIQSSSSESAPKLIESTGKPANVECGAQTLEILAGGTSPEPQGLTIKSCGLTPSLYHWKPEPLEIENQTNDAMNVHLMYFENGKKRTGWNTVIRAHEKRVLAPIELNPEAVAILYSDSKPEAGMTAFFNYPAKHSWVMTRKPLDAKEFNSDGAQKHDF